MHHLSTPPVGSPTLPPSEPTHHLGYQGGQASTTTPTAEYLAPPSAMTAVMTFGNNMALQGVNCALQNTIEGDFYQITHVYTNTTPLIGRINQLPPVAEPFIGRTQSRERLVMALSGLPPTMGMMCSLYGMGGIGKTALAVRVAHAVADVYDAVIFIEMNYSVESPTCTVVKALHQVIRPFWGYPTALPTDVGELSALYRQVLNGRRCLIVLDDVGDQATIRAFMPPAGCAVLVTSRARLLWDGPANAWAVPTLNSAEAEALLLNRVPHLADDPLLPMLLERCGYLPLALRLVGTIFADFPKLTIRRYLERLEGSPAQGSALNHADESVYDIIGRSDDQLARVNPVLATRWRMLAICADAFPSSVAAALWDESDSYLVESQLIELCRVSLLHYEPTTRRYSIPRLLRDIAHQRCESRFRALATMRYTEFFQRLNTHAERLLTTPIDRQEGLELLQATWPHLLGTSEYLQRQNGTKASRFEGDLVSPSVFHAIRRHYIQSAGCAN